MNDLSIHILGALLEHPENFTSGSMLAQKFNISRVSIWKHIEHFNAMGIGVEAIRNRGYRLIQQPLILCGPLLKAYCNIQNPRCFVHFYESIDSTNSAAQRLLSEGAPTPFVVVSKTQTAGRGRLGRGWASQDDKNLYLSFGFKPLKNPEFMECFTLWMGTALAQGLRTCYTLPIEVKWPNDLMIGSKKCCGILTEAVVDADHIKETVVGIGLNINGCLDKLPESIRPVATSLFLDQNLSINIHKVAAEVIRLVLTAYQDYIHGNYLDNFCTLWRQLDYLYNKSVRI